jgi:FMN phosphatase YigB (HAD superfamily)
MGKITKLAVFDFDGTLVDTPLPENGRKEYKAKTGQDWPFPGWWGQPLSLNMDIFDMPTVPMVMSAYQREKSNPTTGMIMLTGRMVKLGDKVKDILDSKNLSFDEYHYNRGGSTDVAKIKTLDDLLERYPNVIDVEMWDDRDEHLPIFQAWGDKLVSKGRLKSFKINHVPAERH